MDQAEELEFLKLLLAAPTVSLNSTLRPALIARLSTMRPAFDTCESTPQKQKYSRPSLAHSMHSIVHQKNSWDRFKVSQTGFSRIFGSDGIYPPFLDFVRAFGTKFDAKDEDFGGFNYRFRTATRAHKAYGASPFSIHDLRLPTKGWCFKSYATMCATLSAMGEKESIHGHFDTQHYTTS
jgi:hypothetical protein